MWCNDSAIQAHRMYERFEQMVVAAKEWGGSGMSGGTSVIAVLVPLFEDDKDASSLGSTRDFPNRAVADSVNTLKVSVILATNIQGLRMYRRQS